MDSCSFKNCTSLYGDYINFGEISDYYIVDCIFDAEPNNIDFNYSNGIITVTKEIVKDEHSLDDLERAYASCDFDSIY